MVMSFAMDAGRSEDGIGGGHGMDEQAERHLGHTTIKFKEVCGTGKSAIPFGEVPLDRATEYAAEDADVTWRLHCVLRNRLAAEGGTGARLTMAEVTRVRPLTISTQEAR